MRVVHVINAMNAGGAEHLLLQQLCAAGPRWDAQIICIGAEGSLGPSVRAAGIPLLALESRAWISIRTLSALRAAIQQCAPDIVHLHLPRAGIAGRLAAIGAQVPVVYTEHNVWETFHPVTRHLNALTYGLNDLVISVSAEVQRSIMAHKAAHRLRRRPVIVRNGIDVAGVATAALPAVAARAHLRLPANALVVGTVGNLFRRKGHSFLMHAAAALRHELPHLHTVIVGEGREYERLVGLAADLDITNAVSITRGVGHASRYMRGFDLFVLPSIFEGLPIALLEAMALELPIVASAVGGIPEVITDGENGVLVPPADVQALSGAIRQLVADPMLRSGLARAARARVADAHDITVMVQALDRLYRSLLTRGGA